MTLTLHTDIFVSRRQRVHVVFNDVGLALFSHREVAACLAFIYGSDHQTFDLTDGERRWSMHIEAVSPPI